MSEEELRSDAIKYLSIIDEEWETIIQDLMVGDKDGFDYEHALKFSLKGLKYWVKSIGLLTKLVELKNARNNRKAI